MYKLTRTRKQEDKVPQKLEAHGGAGISVMGTQSPGNLQQMFLDVGRQRSQYCLLVACRLRSRYTLTGRNLKALTLWRGLKTVDNRELGCLTRTGRRGHFLRTHRLWSLPPHPVSSSVSKRQSTSQLTHKGNAQHGSGMGSQIQMLLSADVAELDMSF